MKVTCGLRLALCLVSLGCATAHRDVSCDTLAGRESVPSWMAISMLPLKGGELTVRVGVVEPGDGLRGEVLFLHGFADRADNHGPLFRAWAQQGLRVVAFDYPSHGETCGSMSALTRYDFNDLAEIAVKVVESRGDSRLPLLLAGWSTGGLLAVRMLQDNTFPRPGRPVVGAILLAPAIVARVPPGEMGTVTLRSLTSNDAAPHYGKIQPDRPLEQARFTLSFADNGKKAFETRYPRAVQPALQTLVFIADYKLYHYVVSPLVKEWIVANRATRNSIVGVQCKTSLHELDNEPNPVGPQVIAMAAAFARLRVDGRPDDGVAEDVYKLVRSPCERI